MQTKKNITPRNEKGEPDGYWEIYNSNDMLWHRGTYVDGVPNGYWEIYYDHDRLLAKGNCVNGERVGLWVEGYKKVFYAN